jgi:hypothetical protein
LQPTQAFRLEVRYDQLRSILELRAGSSYYFDKKLSAPSWNLHEAIADSFEKAFQA